MQVSNTIPRGWKLARILACAATLSCGLLSLAMMPAHAQSAARHQSAKKVELGTGAAVDARGNFWIVTKEVEGADQYVVLQGSSDGGRTWTAPRRIQREPEAVSAEGENRPKLAFGPQGEMYITYTKPLAKPYTGEIRFIRSLDGGKTFTPPRTVHANRDLITHRFESMIVDGSGRIYITWIDKRDLEAATAHKEKYAGAAVYYAVSEDGGNSFKGDYKLADHSCECCRIALALQPDGRPAALWRHVFEPNVRDHAIAVLAPDGKASAPVRATFDDWRIDACPHHGPALAYADDGTRHQVWFNMRGEEGGVYYAAVSPAGRMSEAVRLGSAQAAHGDVAVDGKNIAVAWKQFDGKGTAILSRLSSDGGLTWREQELARTAQGSDQPRLLKTPGGITLAWRTQQDGMRIVPVMPARLEKAEK